MCPQNTERGDIVCVFLGDSMPVILRSVDRHFQFVGECYVHGIMRGEAMDDLKKGVYDTNDFELHW